MQTKSLTDNLFEDETELKVPLEIQLPLTKVSLLQVDSLWGDCTFIPADRGS